jgi:hypothetical protein
MTGYEDFFEELKSCYESHGLAFKYSLDHYFPTYYPKNYFKTQKNKPSSCNNKVGGAFGALHGAIVGLRGKSTKNKIKRSYPKTFENFDRGASENKWGPATQEFDFFRDVPDMLYRLSLRLSRKIGRLPDNLHARMVFAVGLHPSVSEYINTFGA